MGKMLSCLLVALLMNGLTANQDQEDLTVNQGLEDLTTTQGLVLRKLVTRVVPWGFPVQPAWFIKLIWDKYRALEKTLVIEAVMAENKPKYAQML